MKKYIMSVWRNGLIDISKTVPDGAIKVGEGSKKDLEAWCVYARLARDGSGQYFANGIPEAQTDDEAMDALMNFQKIIGNKMFGRPAFEGLERS